MNRIQKDKLICITGSVTVDVTPKDFITGILKSQFSMFRKPLELNNDGTALGVCFDRSTHGIPRTEFIPSTTNPNDIKAYKALKFLEEYYKEDK